MNHHIKMEMTVDVPDDEWKDFLASATQLEADSKIKFCRVEADGAQVLFIAAR